MLDFSIRTQGMGNAINTSQNINLDWQFKSFRTEKSVKYENQYTDLRYIHNGGEFEYMSAMSDEEAIDKLVEAVINKQIESHQFDNADVTFRDVRKIKRGPLHYSLVRE